MPVINPLTQVGNSIIRKKASKVKLPLSSASKKLIKDLIDTLEESNLVGLAAPQIGVSRRVFVTQVKKTKFRNETSDKLRIFVNPEIIELSNDYELGYEGCGSVAESNLFGQVFRSKSLIIKYFDENGKVQKNNFFGFVARVIQHEFDHLEGIVFLDRLADSRTLMSGSEFKKSLE